MAMSKGSTLDMTSPLWAWATSLRSLGLKGLPVVEGEWLVIYTRERGPSQARVSIGEEYDGDEDLAYVEAEQANFVRRISIKGSLPCQRARSFILFFHKVIRDPSHSTLRLMAPANLPTIITAAQLSAIRLTPGLPPDTWYFITAIALSALNRPDEITTVLKYALETGAGPNEDLAAPAHDEQLRIIRRMREALIKSIVALGMPRTINALLALKPRTPPSLLDGPNSPPPSGRSTDLVSTPTPTILARGQRYFDGVYGPDASAAMASMAHSGNPDLAVAGRLLYGYILSGGTDVLTPLETSWLTLAALIPQDVNLQLKSHMKGAVRHGATVEEVHVVRGVVVGICEAAGMVRLSDGSQHRWGWKGEVAKL